MFGNMITLYNASDYRLMDDFGLLVTDYQTNGLRDK